jgi:hypothetical protein
MIYEVPDALLERVCRHAKRLGVEPEQFVEEAVEWACEREEQPHIPRQVTEARPRVLSSGAMMLPKGVTPTGLV